MRCCTIQWPLRVKKQHCRVIGICPLYPLHVLKGGATRQNVTSAIRMYAGDFGLRTLIQLLHGADGLVSRHGH